MLLVKRVGCWEPNIVQRVISSASPMLLRAAAVEGQLVLQSGQLSAAFLSNQNEAASKIGAAPAVAAGAFLESF